MNNFEKRQKVIYIQNDEAKFIRENGNQWELYRDGRSFEIDPYGEESHILDEIIIGIGNKTCIKLGNYPTLRRWINR